MAERAAVPDPRARRLWTSPSPPGAYTTIRWRRFMTEGDHRRVALLLTEDSYASPGGKTSTSQPGHGIDVLPPSHPGTASAQRADCQRERQAVNPDQARPHAAADLRPLDVRRTRGSRQPRQPAPTTPTPHRRHDPRTRSSLTAATPITTRHAITTKSDERPGRSHLARESAARSVAARPMSGVSGTIART